MARVDPPLEDVQKKQIQLFGQKKKSTAERVLEELRQDNTPAVLIRLPNDQVGVFNLKTNKYEYKGDIRTESRTIQSNVQNLGDFSVARNITRGEQTVIEQESGGDGLNVITSDDIFGKGTRYEPDIYSDPAFGGGLFIEPELARQNQTPIATAEVAFAEDTEGDRSATPFVEQDFPRRLTNLELNPQLRGPNPDDSFIVRVGDTLKKAFSPKTIVAQSPVSGAIRAINQPVLQGIISQTMGLPMAYAFEKVGEKLQQVQIRDATRAAEGVKGYSAFTAIDLSTGLPVDITSFQGRVTHENISGPIAFDGRFFSTAIEAATYAEENGLVQDYAYRMYGDIERLSEENVKYDVGRQRVLVDPSSGMGDYNPESGTVRLAGGIDARTTGLALAGDGVTLAFKTNVGGAGFVTDSEGKMIKTTGGGIATTGLRGGVATKNIYDLSLSEVQSLLNGVHNKEIEAPNQVISTLESMVDNYVDPMNQFTFDYQYGDYAVPDIPSLTPTEVEFGDPTGLIGGFQEGESGVIYESQVDAGSKFSETLTSDVYSEDYSDLNQSTDINADVNQETGDAGFGFDDPTGGFDFKKGGKIPKQEGGTTVKPVSQIVQGAGFIAPQNNATEQQTIADDIPMEAEEGDFIINAPAAQFAGRQDIVDMILKAIDSLGEKGVDIQYGNPKIPIKRRVQLAVSRNEVYVPRIIAEEIGYDKLEKINNRGKKEVERRQQEAQQQANRGGFITKASGDVVEKESEEDTATQVAGLRELIEGFINKLKKPSPVPKREPTEKELEDSKYEFERKKIKVNFRDFIRDRLKNLKLKNENEIETYDLLTDIEISPKVDPRRGNVPITQEDKSGLTLGLGFDLGRQGIKELQNYGFSKSLIEKLTPYLGLRGQVARKKHNKDMAFALTDEELDQVNRQVITYGMKEFERDHPEYKTINPMDYAVLYSAYHVGGLRPDGTRNGKRIKRTPENPKAVRYITFKNVYDGTNDVNQALQKGLIDKISKGKAERNRAISAKKWFKTRPILSERIAPIPKPKKARVRSRKMITPKAKPQEMIMPKPRPNRIQDNPDQGSFLSSSMRV